MPNCYSNLTEDQLRAAVNKVIQAPKRRWLKVGPNAGMPPAWAEGVLMSQALAEKQKLPLTFEEAKMLFKLAVQIHQRVTK